MQLRPNINLVSRPMILAGIPHGAGGVRTTLRIMRKMVRKAKRFYPLREFALRLVENLPPKDHWSEIRAIQQFVRENIRYIKDIHGIETVAEPQITLEIGQGDCDDQSVLTATLLELIGYPSRFAAIGFKNNHFVHVYTEVFNGGQWVSVETTENVPIGWKPPGIKTVMVQPI